MADPLVAPFGTWTSPISAQVVAAQGLRLGLVTVDGDDIYWVEGRPHEGGRNVLVRRTPDGRVADVTPRGVNVRTRVHEYGSGAYLVFNGTAYYSNFADQRVYRIPGAPTAIGPPGESDRPTGDPEPLTPEGNWFYADYAIDVRRQRLICVREDHTQQGREPINTLVSIPIGGSANEDPPDEAADLTRSGQHPLRNAAGDRGAGDVIASGYDFYSTPRLSPDGSTLTWICWRHPNMPWDGTELWIADVTLEGRLANERRVAGGADESIYQPGWSPDGTLYFVSDRDGWWRLYRSDRSDRSSRSERSEHANDPNGPNDPNVQPVLSAPLDDAEFGRPQWQFGSATWVFAGSVLLVSYTRAGRWHLATIDAASGTLTPVATGVEPADWLAATPTYAVFVGGSATMPQAVVKLEIAGSREQDPADDTQQDPALELRQHQGWEILRSSSSLQIDPAYISAPQAIEFTTGPGLMAHAFYYAPRNKDFVGPGDERPPLIVIGHGGPTTAARATLDLQVQFWTSRGCAVVDVNYGGSSGYGRPYRQRLKGQWGIVDVADCAHAAAFLVAEGRADPRRLIIRGGSAGGYTTLAALTFHPGVFKAGASYYGISDIAVLAHDTHKFESRYLDSLIGPYPEAQELYRARSPIHFVDRLSCALILFQGLEDQVVPPNQSQMMADAVRAKGLPVALLTFEGEQHGFRKAETIVRCLEAELYFYGVAFGFTPADRVDGVTIDNIGSG